MPDKNGNFIYFTGISHMLKNRNRFLEIELPKKLYYIRTYWFSREDYPTGLEVCA
ncbi:hypothetical protein STRMA_0738 [Streptococcus macacae NCTC 11558]|uniref:Uncharacterized protein n=1 Tax=Streptococcus macacae NCTC 11558 TaxID=764298 RepID=G5JVG4_9STRE|nr:hypothetical protein STRMA_0738 [Streptococcus macacae NCTC 11558]